jgi:hypothetical protein
MREEDMEAMRAGECCTFIAAGLQILIKSNHNLSHRRSVLPQWHTECCIFCY